MNTRSFASHNNSPYLLRSSDQRKVALGHIGGGSRRWQTKRKGTEIPLPAKTGSEFELEDTEIVLRQRALSQARCGNFEGAIALFDTLLQKNPYSARDYNNRGLVQFQHGNLDAALADYNQALLINPYLDGAYNNRANYYAAVGLFLEAVLDYDAALDLNPDNIRAWINQGITFRDLQMHDRAIESFDIALSLGRLQGHIYAERGRTYFLRGDWNCAMADFQRAKVALEDPDAIATGSALRLRHQVDTWLNELLSPLTLDS